MGAVYLFYMKSIETHTRAFLALIILGIGTVFCIFGLKPSGLFPIWCCLRPGASHGLRAATMERSGFSEFQSDPVINWKIQSDPVYKLDVSVRSGDKSLILDHVSIKIQIDTQCIMI